MNRLRSLDDVTSARIMTGVWAVAGTLTVLIPVFMWYAARGDYYNVWGQYIEYEQEEENGDDNNDDDYSYYQDCGWWNLPCRKQQYNYAMYDDSGDGQNEELPMWFIFLGGQTEQMQRWEEEATGRRDGGNQSSSAALRFVYVWTLIMFLFIVAYGTYVLYKRQGRTSLILILLLFSQFCLMSLVLVPQGVISSDDRDLEDSIYGWYGQQGVLLEYTNLWLMLFCVVFGLGFGIQAFWEWRKGNIGESNASKVSDEYQNYDAPQVQLTGS